jgi:hypothetical protein
VEVSATVPGRVALEPISGKTFVARPSEQVIFKVENMSLAAVDVTLLYANGASELCALFPTKEQPQGSNYLPKEGSEFLSTGPTPMDARPGVAYLFVLAVKSNARDGVSFSGLAGPTLEESRAAGRGLDQRRLAPLRDLLEAACFGKGRGRGLTRGAAEECFLDVIPVKIETVP